MDLWGRIQKKKFQNFLPFSNNMQEHRILKIKSTKRPFWLEFVIFLYIGCCRRNLDFLDRDYIWNCELILYTLNTGQDGWEHVLHWRPGPGEWGILYIYGGETVLFQLGRRLQSNHRLALCDDQLRQLQMAGSQVLISQTSAVFENNFERYFSFLSVIV